MNPLGRPQVGRLLVVTLVVVLGSSGCNGGAGRTTGPAQIVFEDLRFVPNRIDAKAGVPLTIRLVNRGTERHDLNFPSLHMPGLEGVDAILEPGESTTVTLRFDEAGTHTFICTLPGHAASGMTGAAFVAP